MVIYFNIPLCERPVDAAGCCETAASKSSAPSKQNEIPYFEKLCEHTIV